MTDAHKYSHTSITPRTDALVDDFDRRADTLPNYGVTDLRDDFRRAIVHARELESKLSAAEAERDSAFSALKALGIDARAAIDAGRKASQELAVPAQVACAHPWPGPGEQPAKFECQCGAVVYRSYADYCDD